MNNKTLPAQTIYHQTTTHTNNDNNLFAMWIQCSEIIEKNTQSLNRKGELFSLQMTQFW